MLSIGGAETNENYTLNEKLTKKDDKREDRMKKIAFFPRSKTVDPYLPTLPLVLFFLPKDYLFL